MAFDKDLNLIDIYKGKEDLENKVIRAVGNPSVRFNEDALRILRGYYFAAKLNFEIDLNTIIGMDENSEFINCVSGERVTRELIKLFNQKNQHKGIFYLLNSKTINYLPSLKNALIKIYNIGRNISFIELLCLGFYLDGKTDRYILKKAEKKQIDKVLDLIDQEFDSFILFNNQIEDLLIANEIKKILNMPYLDNLIDMKNQLVLKNIKDLNIKPKDLINAGFKNEEIGKKMNEALRLVLDKKINNNKEEILNSIK
jgi:tRNA nucleotidyltransferase (CCA-adding enzyme)